ncbi:MAG TPA: efflux RND transporter periplasmic adaptor subunit [Steroidobacteraceae bacterium]|jgi:multidrug efflux system membrane fusion protein|nr:efflux RND transporter periplasmic adaptor subunit [Steroidobacteraceae bacterium]
MTDAAKNTPSEPPSHIVRYAWIALGVALILAAWGIISRVHARSQLAKETTAEAVPQVTTLKPGRSPASEDLVLPGSVQAFIEAPIYARTSGYLKSWSTDIGAPVKKGQLLAEIDSPEVDQQYSQAQADLATAHANSQLAITTNERWQGLLATHSVSQQDADSKAGDAAAKRAAEASAAANVARLRDLESFKRVIAPFDGVVTQRSTDIGALIAAGQNAGAALFRVADTTKLRIYVLVPEPYAAATVPGMEAALYFTEHPGRSFPATVVRTANALDPALRTLQVELQVDNANSELFPGAYAEVHFKVPGSSQSLRVPANTLLFRAAGLQVATVDAENHVHLKTIVPGRDFGKSIEVLSGIGADDDVVVNPPDSLIEDAPVRIAPPPQPASQQQGGRKTS